MDAVKFLQERKRMFLNGDSSLIHLMDTDVDPEVLVRDVERWSAAHPLKTRQNAFLKQWPGAEIDCQGALVIEPCCLDKAISEKTCHNINCDDCRRQFWMQEVE